MTKYFRRKILSDLDNKINLWVITVINAVQS